MQHREAIIRHYVDAYNRFDTEGMVRDFDDAIRFENISGGQTTLVLNGIAEFKAQAEEMKKVFASRTQTIRSFRHRANETEIDISYQAVIAMDLPNLKKGDELNLQGKSVFRFSGDKIVGLEDIS